MNKALCFPARNAFGFFSPHSLMLPSKGKRKGRWQLGVPSQQSAWVCSSFLMSEFFLSQSLNDWLQGLGIPGCPRASQWENGQIQTLLYKILTAHFYCKQQLLAIKARPFPYCFVNNLDDKSTCRWYTDLSFISVRPDADLSLPFHCKTQIRTWISLKWLRFNLNKTQLSFVEGGREELWVCRRMCHFSLLKLSF